MRQHPHLTRHHRKPFTLRTGTRRFHSGVQRQQVGLEGNAFNHADDIDNFIRTAGNITHMCLHPRNNHAALRRCSRGFQRQLAGLPGVLSVLADGRGQVLHIGTGLHQRGRLFFGAL
ncbi:hypothetical protein SRABI106_04198 [Rahnella aquatilis]|nr:hypothetical protein SRABI106_04198 [Rahnella aquatilis]